MEIIDNKGYNITIGVKCYLFMNKENSRNLLKDIQTITRRDLLKSAIGGGLGIAGGFSVQRSLDIAKVSAEKESEPVNFGLPVSSLERDERVRNIAPTEIIVSDALKTDFIYPEVGVESIGFNPIYSGIEAQNRLDLTMSNALIRSHEMSKKYIKDINGKNNYVDLERFLQSGGYPPSDPPDWQDYLRRLEDMNEDLSFSLMAVPEGVPAEAQNVQWMEADIRQGVQINYVPEPGPIRQMFSSDGDVASSCTIRVDDNKQLNLDIYSNMHIFYTWDLSSIKPSMNPQEIYNFWYSFSTLQALDVLTSTLGIFYTHQTGNNLFQRDAGARVIEREIMGTSFMDQADLMVGGNPLEVGVSELVFSVNFGV